MAGIKPPAGFERQPLDIETIPSGRRFGRIYASVFPDPLGFGKTPSRFSDPRRRDATKRFGVLYLGETLKVCFLEAVLRDRGDGLVGDLPIDEKKIYARRYAEIETIADLSFVDLRDDHAIGMGVPTDVAKSSLQSLARSWALAFHEHPSLPDGIIYPSRLNGHTIIAVFGRAVPPARQQRFPWRDHFRRTCRAARKRCRRPYLDGFTPAGTQSTSQVPLRSRDIGALA